MKMNFTETAEEKAGALSREELIADTTAMFDAGFKDEDFVRLASMIWLHVIKPEKPEAVYEEYPELTQYVTESLGHLEAFCDEYRRRFTWNDKNM